MLAPRHQALVSSEVRQISLNSMVGVPNNEDDVEAEKQDQIEDDDEFDRLHQPDGPDPEDKGFVAAHVKKRKLYRQHTGTDVPWFPHDNDMELLKELCWEGGKPRWVCSVRPLAGLAPMVAWSQAAASSASDMTSIIELACKSSCCRGPLKQW